MEKSRSRKRSIIGLNVTKRTGFFARKYSGLPKIGSATAENTKESDIKALSAINAEWK
jgi:hypothetical protein